MILNTENFDVNSYYIESPKFESATCEMHASAWSNLVRPRDQQNFTRFLSCICWQYRT